MQYVCQAIQNNICVEWVAQSNFITELSMLSYADANQLLSYTVANFALAWVWRHLSRTAYKH